MDVSRFDSFARSLAEIVSRRGILGAVGAGLSGIAALAGMGAGDPFGAEARRKRKRKGKKKKCKNGKTKCNGKCRNLDTNENNCGSCGNACEPDKECQSGNCVGNGCTPDCQGAACGDSDGCGGACDGACEGLLTCDNGVCACEEECCSVDDCPPGAAVTCDDGACECNLEGACCFDSDCPVNRECISVNNTGFCFCKPDSVPCGTPPVCCNPGQVCEIGSGTCSS